MNSDTSEKKWEVNNRFLAINESYCSSGNNWQTCWFVHRNIGFILYTWISNIILTRTLLAISLTAEFHLQYNIQTEPVTVSEILHTWIQWLILNQSDFIHFPGIPNHSWNMVDKPTTIFGSKPTRSLMWGHGKELIYSMRIPNNRYQLIQNMHAAFDGGTKESEELRLVLRALTWDWVKP